MMKARSPLAGVTVIEVGEDVGLRYCGRLFSILGADVVRVRTDELAPTAPGERAFQAWLNECKRDGGSLDQAIAAAGGAPDIVIVGQDVSSVRSIDQELQARQLEVLRLGLTWFGSDGPYSSWHGDDGLIQALIGVASSFGAVDGPPMLPQGRAPQITAGATMFVAALGALWGRQGGLQIRTVDVNVLEAAIAFTETTPPTLERTPGRSVRRGVNRFPANHPTTVYPTQDGWLGVTTLTPAQWAGLATLIGRPEWCDDPRFNNSAGRVTHADLLDDELRRVLLTNTTEHWLIEGQKLRVPLAPVPRPAEVPSTPHWVERESFAPLTHADEVLAPRLPFRTFPDGHTLPRRVPVGDAPLNGIRVVDFSMGWAGPLCTRLLADMGADVVKIESATHYDWWRGWEPLGASDPPAYELNPVFNAMNRGKRGVSLDLTRPEGAARARDLVAGADIVIENYAPGVMAKLGLAPETLQALRPGLVMVSMGAFGATGPWSFFRAYGSTVEHASGMPHVNGEADWPPCLQHAAYGDPVAGIYAAVAALSALHGRHREGGAWIDLAQVECLFQLGADAIISAQIEGDPPRLGNRSVRYAPRCVVPTADAEGWLAVTVTSEGAWRALCGVLGKTGWLSDPAFTCADARNRRHLEIEAAIAQWAGERASADAAATLQAAGVPAAPVVPGHDLADQVQLAASGCWMRMERKHVGSHIQAAPVFRFNGRRPPPSRPAPLLGEHTTEVLGELEAII